MCGRYRLKEHKLSKLAARFGLAGAAAELKSRLNIRPTELAPVIVQKGAERSLELQRWGLVPSWSRDAKAAAKCINARGETIDTLPSFRDSFKSKRCLVVTDGFYEWKGKEPWLFAREDEEPFALAGLWAEWKSPTGPWHTFTIVTTSANEQLRPFHERMPVILPKESEQLWLADDSSPETLKALVAPSKEKLAAAPSPPLPKEPGA